MGLAMKGRPTEKFSSSGLYGMSTKGTLPLWSLHATVDPVRFLNRVELQNGCLSLGHANLFIPSMLFGSNIDPETGKIHRERFVSNMEQATEVYINQVNGSPCGETNIHLFKGADSSANQDLCLYLLPYLKGTKAQKERLRQEHTEVYDHIERIWTIHNNHIVQDLPAQYMFFFSVLL